MTSKRAFGLICLLMGCLAGVAEVAAAQEPGFFYGNGALRYAEAAGYFHYVFPCGVQDANAAAGTGKPAQLAGICWPVYAGRRLKADGSADPARPVPGVLLVAAQVVVFIPNEKGNEGVMPQLVPKEITFSYDARQVVASMGTKTGTYSFAFRGVCEGCKPGAPVIDVKKTAQMDAEYAEFAKSLTDFESLLKSVSERSGAVNVGVEPKDQPGLDDVPEAMGLYSDLNRRLAPMCGESARACVLQYAGYQACKKNDLHAACGDAPVCEASCALTRKDSTSLGVAFCQAKGAKTMALVPDWSASGERLRAKQAAFRAARSKEMAGLSRATVDAAKTDGAGAAAKPPPLDFMGKPTSTDAVCSVESSYAMAMMSASMRGAGGIGDLQQGAVGPQISAGAALNNRLSDVAPIYPAVAKAARVSGTVVLDIMITEKGEVIDISVASGPPLLQSAAIDAVKQWKYKPYVLNGEARKVKTKVYVNFGLGDGIVKTVGH